jgi:hypothetical protein
VVEPRIRAVPEAPGSLGADASKLAEDAGLVLDPWQRAVLDGALGVVRGGAWAAFEVGLVVGRQNGKGAVLEARELAGLFLFGERLIIHSAHQFDTSMEAFLRMEQLLEEAGLVGQLKPRGGVSRSHGSEGFLLKSGQRLRYRTRTKGGGRGFSADCLILDEAMFLPESSHGALLPTLAARPNPQVWYAGSAVDQMTQENGIVFARVRERGHAGTDPRLAYFEWSVDGVNPDTLTVKEMSDPRLWQQANPGLGIRITLEHVANEQRSMDQRTFATERLGVGDWPATSRTAGVFDQDVWEQLGNPRSDRPETVCFAVDATTDRSRATIAAAGYLGDGIAQTEIVDTRPGTGWVVERLAELHDKHDPVAIVLDGRGPAASLLHELKEADVPVETVGASEYANACGLFYDMFDQRRLRHLAQPELNASVRAAAKRDLGEAWAWSRRRSTADPSPLISATLAVWGVSTRTQTVYSRRGVVTV